MSLTVSEALLTLGLAGAAFVSTNLDNLVLLIAFLTRKDYRTWQVSLGYLGAVALVVVASFAAGRALEFIPPRALSYLGVVPIGLGVWYAYVAWRRKADDDGSADPQPQPRSAFLAVASVAAVSVSNSGDTLAVLIPMLADSRAIHDLVAAAAWMVMAVLWFALSIWVARRPLTGQLMQRVGEPVLPLVLIAIGIYVLLDTPTDTM